ncbi:MAG: Diaminopimelate epimerase (EC [uncultured Sulfurovum sp.]|uniref:Diaminopimelate epimerase n=1 Tax=uncultured Sulfurovum sp. TaxID=269237 RepID=A0A6S6T219_9BACT|nr:MAG: Diaminopimelate epimerase (EC [uncultured Sulfurovum sp.]
MTVTKYSASGNDFVIIIRKKKKDRSKLAKRLCHRHNGVGADGLVVIMPHQEYDFEWDFYNADGSYASMCGNASRAVAHFAMEKGISQDGKAEFITGAGLITANVNGNYVTTDMTKPIRLSTELEEDGERWWFIDTGVPHIVGIRDNIDVFDLVQAKRLRDKFNANVNICKVENEDTLYVRTFERGVEDETLACGTGMVACFIRANDEDLVNDDVKIFPKSGDELYVSLEEDIYRFAGEVKKTFVAETID